MVRKTLWLLLLAVAVCLCAATAFADEAETVDFDVSVLWTDKNDQDGIRPSNIEVIVRADIVDYTRTVTLDAESGWSATLTDMPRYSDGQTIGYRAIETGCDGYSLNQRFTYETGLELENVHQPETRSLRINKVWVDENNADGLRPVDKQASNAVTISLYADGELYKEYTPTYQSQQWAFSFTQLPKYRDGGIEIVYTIMESAIPGYTTTYADVLDDQGVITGIEVTNTLDHVVERRDIDVSVCWIDSENSQSTRPESVTVYLVKKVNSGTVDISRVDPVVLNDANNWSCTFRDLPKNENANEIAYSVRQVSVDGYTWVVNGDIETGFTISDIYGATQCGDYAYWTLDENGLLAIRGTGVITYQFWEQRDSILKVVIDEGITEIGLFVFNDCWNLKSVLLPKSITNIGDYAFCNCNNLTSISIPDSITSIGEFAFSNCRSLTSINIPDSVLSIGIYTFESCESLTSIIIPESINSIGQGAFNGCQNLISVNISEGVTSIDDYAFSWCGNLAQVTIPGSVTSIGAHAFERCDHLTAVTIPEGVISIGEQAFYADSELKKLVMPRSVTDFGANIVNSVPTVYLYAGSPAEEWAWTEYLDMVFLDDEEQASEIRSLTIEDDFRIACGKEKILRYNVFPLYDNPTVTWISSAPEIVSVENGVIKAMSVGTANVTASCGEASATVSIQVYQSVEDFEIIPTESWVIARYTSTFTPVNVQPENAEALFAWELSDYNYATISYENSVFVEWDFGGYYANTIASVRTIKPGDITITATSELGVERSALIHICFPVTAIDLTAPKTVLSVDESVQLTANVTMRTQSCVNHLVRFSSDNEAVATVNPATGLLTAHSAGTATITATADSGVNASITVTVGEAGSRILTLPASLTTIESGAFTGLPAVDAIRIPARVSSIAADAFDPGMTLILSEGSPWTQWATDNGYKVLTE